MDGNGSPNLAKNSVGTAELNDEKSSPTAKTELSEETTEEGVEEKGDYSSNEKSEDSQSDETPEDEADDGQFRTPTPSAEDTADSNAPNHSEGEESAESASECNDDQDFERIEDNVIDLDNNELNYDEEEDEEENSSKSDKRHRNSFDCGRAEQISDSDEQDGASSNCEQTKQQTAKELQGEAISSEGEEDDIGRGSKTEIKVDNGEKEEEGELSEGTAGESLEKQRNSEGGDEELEEGELRSDEDSDDGVPEIRGGLSPPGLPLLSSVPSSIASHHHHQQQQQQLLPFSNPPPNPLLPPVPSFDPPMNQSRELCRYFMKGFCVNGEACRFKHSRTDAAVPFQSFESVRKLPTTFLLGRHVIPPPTGPPIPLLSTEFAPPPSLLTAVSSAVLPVNSLVSGVRPVTASAQPNAESAAWERGLRQARAMVRRQQQKGDCAEKGTAEGEGEQMEGEKEQKDDSLVEEQLAAGGDGMEERLQSDSLTLAKVSSDERDSDDERCGAFAKRNDGGGEERNGRIFVPPSVLAPPSGFARRPVVSRVVVEASYSVGVSRLRSSSSPPPSFSDHQQKLQSRAIKLQKHSFGIPSLIDAIREKPIPPPPTNLPSAINSTTFVAKNKKTAAVTIRDDDDDDEHQQQRDQRRVLSTANLDSAGAVAYSDPWARNASSPRRRSQRGRTAQRTHSPHSSASSADELPSRHRNAKAFSVGEAASRHHRSRSSSPKDADSLFHRKDKNDRNKRKTAMAVERKGQRENTGKRSREQRTPPPSFFDDKVSFRRSRHRQSGPDSSTSRSPSRRKSPSGEHRHRRHRRSRRSSPSNYHSLGALLTTNSSTAERSRHHKGPRTPPEPTQKSRGGNSRTSASPVTASGRSSSSGTAPSAGDEGTKGDRKRTKCKFTAHSTSNNSVFAAASVHRFGDGISVSSMPRALANRQPPVICASTKKTGSRRMSSTSDAFLFCAKNTQEDEEDEAPAAYRLPPNAMYDEKGQKRQRSVSSSSSSSSDSSSDSSSSSGSSTSSSSSSNAPLNDSTPATTEKPPLKRTEKNEDTSGNSAKAMDCSTGEQTQQKMEEEEEKLGGNGQRTTQHNDGSGQKQLDKCQKQKVTGGEGKSDKTETVHCNAHQSADFVQNTNKTKTDGGGEPIDAKGKAAPLSAEQSKKRREQLLRQLQSVEEAIARKRQRREGAN